MSRAFHILFHILFLCLPAVAQNVVPVQANTNGHLLSPSQFLLTNIFGAGAITIHRAPTGNGLVLSNSAGDVSLIQLNGTSNSLQTNLMAFDRSSSNYLYSLIVGGGAGEVNVNANAGTTNANIFGLVNPKIGVTNFLKTLEPAYALKGTNQGGTNLQLAVDHSIIPSHTELNTSSNTLRTFILSRPTNTFPASQFTVVGGTQVFIKSSANLTNINSWGGLSAADIITSGQVEVGDLLVLPGLPQNSLLFTDGSGFVQAATIGQYIQFTAGTLSSTGLQQASINLTNWSLYPTNIWNSRQGGSLILSNFIAMGISNIIAGTNVIIYTNAGNLVVNALPGAAGVLATNPNQFGASPILTLKDQARHTNIISVGTLDGQNATFSGSLDVTGAATLPSLTPNAMLGLNALNAIQSIAVRLGLVFDGTNLSAHPILTNLLLNPPLTNITSANQAFISLLQQSNPPIVKTLSAGANMTLTNQGTNIVIATTRGTPSIQTSNFVSAFGTETEYRIDVPYTNDNSWAWVQSTAVLYQDDALDVAAMGLYLDQNADGVYEETNNVASFGGLNSPGFSNPNLQLNVLLRDIIRPGARFVFTNLTIDPGGSPASTATIRPNSSKLWKTGD